MTVSTQYCCLLGSCESMPCSWCVCHPGGLSFPVTGSSLCADSVDLRTRVSRLIFQPLQAVLKPLPSLCQFPTQRLPDEGDSVNSSLILGEAQGPAVFPFRVRVETEKLSGGLGNPSTQSVVFCTCWFVRGSHIQPPLLHARFPCGPWWTVEARTLGFRHRKSPCPAPPPKA